MNAPPVGTESDRSMVRFPGSSALLFVHAQSWLILFAAMFFAVRAHADIRHETQLDSGWRTMAFETGTPAPAGVESAGFDDHAWRLVDVPHNWDEYDGFRQVRHGNRHGTAWYRRTFPIDDQERGRRIFLFFEGVGSYATIWVNGRLVGRHAGGLTTFTLDVTDAIQFDRDNLLVVRADHPAGIRDLPWVCGGCELAYGFSEGTQPFGIFRPVHLVTTATVRIEPFGVHVWNDAEANAVSARVHVESEVKNYDSKPRRFSIVTQVVSPSGTAVLETRMDLMLAPGATETVAEPVLVIPRPSLWSPESPSLYSLVSEVAVEATVLDQTTTSFGIRTIRWPAPGDKDGRLLINGRPFFINGICGYEHNLGANHAFTAEQVLAQVREIESAGFNAYRDAHHPHNLRFQEHWDRDGLLWWPQFGAHIWFDSDAFRANYKALLRDWVKERRNSPSLVLWGLQNESVLPTAFAEECAAIIRQLDPTASSQRKITTCNGGTGTDWDVAQNWSGTYGGDPLTYADDLKRQHLVGEYGAWRSLGLHSEGGYQPQAPLSEDRMTALLETKVRLAESVRDQVAGHFMWLLTTHSNPGRNVGEHGEQMDDGIRPLDRISPANNKGLFTIWGEPTDAYEMYRSNYAPATVRDAENGAASPMVYIVSHTWPDRWTAPGRKQGIIVYSNCDEVELFNDLGDRSLGVRTRAGRGTHFEWNDVEITTNVLYAEGRIDGKVVARDIVLLHHLPAAPRFTAVQNAQRDLVASRAGQNYLYRVNCGGPDYTDHDGNRWLADHDLTPGSRSWGSISWAAEWPYLAPRFGSQRKTYDAIAGTRDPALFQTFRYGRDKLRYVFPVPNGDYDVELYFAEPWYGDGPMWRETTDHGRQSGDGSQRKGSPNFGAGWRRFDLALNGHTVLHDFDLTAEFGRDVAVKKVVPVHVIDGRIELSFPHVAAGQAVISAIAISTANPAVQPPPAAPALISNLHVDDTAHTAEYIVQHALDLGDPAYADVAGGFTSLPWDLLESDWIRTATASRGFRADALLSFTVRRASDVYVAQDAQTRLPWLRDWDATGATVTTNAFPSAKLALYRRGCSAGTTVTLGSPARTGSMYCVFVVPRRPPSPATLIHDLTTTDPGAWQPIGSIRSGGEIYADATLRLLTLPSALSGGDLLAPRESGSPAAVFSVSDYVEVYVAVDPRAKQPVFQDWIKVRDTITATDGTKFALLKHRLDPGQKLRLPAASAVAGAHPYFTIVRAVRPSMYLEAEDAALTSARVLPGAVGASGHGAVNLPAGADHAITWTVPVGVGDRYGLDFRFTAATPCPATTGELAIIAADGRVLRTDRLQFPPVTTPGAWQYLRTRTGSSINAGTYHFRLTLHGVSPLIIDSLEVE